MYSAAFIFEPGDYDAEFHRLNALIGAAAKANPGYLGVESWVAPDGKKRNATYYWRDLESLHAFSQDPNHLEAKRRYAQWYRGYNIVISEVIRADGDGAFPHLVPSNR